ncbi:hypothetical protein L905_23670 [Agrobacterium sp. TS43]|jgi:uncharacterized protein YlxW (UPF0749 family)|nr:hypothetical protein L902_05320 [Agrobacterium radiobacter DSM 30147]KVK39755.1 hypothetical protein L903_15640 [Agrobacterium sp. JL28]KVK48082.1 hypothetical protein L901_04075 [Agrobacterium sp. D14]KVK51521.1 hypothetical protein L904_16330 [Agrobacterium sp. LY4]KVK54094.1 hypothetical protein L906_15580 [Agrobacterium sp. TS45]KVK56841.1 hypothetical protein L907_15545 [Agrobacterium sp. C13]KVK58535.1 hypothetical protein L905_23670 [Agrobacterium sp. TS43]
MDIYPPDKVLAVGDKPEMKMKLAQSALEYGQHACSCAL